MLRDVSPGAIHQFSDVTVDFSAISLMAMRGNGSRQRYPESPTVEAAAEVIRLPISRALLTGIARDPHHCRVLLGRLNTRDGTVSLGVAVPGVIHFVFSDLALCVCCANAVDIRLDVRLPLNPSNTTRAQLPSPVGRAGTCSKLRTRKHLRDPDQSVATKTPACDRRENRRNAL